MGVTVFWRLVLALLTVSCSPRVRDPWSLSSNEERPDRSLRLRIHVSGGYAAEPIGTHGQLRGIVRDADALLWSRVGAHLVIDEIVDGWKVDGQDSMDALRALASSDTGDGVDVVVGMLPSAAHEADGCLGRAQLGGHVMVVRGEEGDVDYEHQFAVVAFLHELGHVLGAPHDDEPGSIMNAYASIASRTYGSTAVQILQNGLAHHGVVAELRPTLRSKSAVPVATRTVSDADRGVLDAAIAAERRGDVEGAWKVAEALFSSYPDVVAVQDLRCRLAQARGLPWPVVRAECEPLMHLTTGATNPLE